MLARDCFDPATMVNKPPRPPCWRDFVPEGKASKQKTSAISKSLDFADLQKLSRSPKESRKDGAKSLPGAAKSHTHPRKKSKSKLHRTSSQLNIEQTDLPETEGKTFTLADTKPNKIGLQKRVLDARIYIDENTRRCAAWLAGVKACEPLEDIAFAQGSGVEIEVPDDSNREAQPQHTISASSSDSSFEDNALPCHSGRVSLESSARSKAVNDVYCTVTSSDNCEARLKRSNRKLSNKENRSFETENVTREIKSPGGQCSQLSSYSVASFYVDPTDIQLENT